MGTRLTIVIETKHDIETLQGIVSLIDAHDSGEEDAIAPENVTAWDIVCMAAVGEIGFVELLDKVEWYNGIPDLAPILEKADGDMHKAFDGVIVNKMETI